ncbi:MAG TPA: lysylphosphatidylglycerol synthase transmembrane domain-containing protein, partial [Gemmatimonadaceae bacterium]|nr:lysylphosphatidylglycerol synthase transmembrane domain-containing protein [Gemmatimonadaceae bacterium]
MSAMCDNNRHRVSAAVVVLALIVACIAYARRVEWWTVLAAIRQTAPAGLALAFALHALALVAKAGVWWIYLRALGAPAFAAVVRITFVGAALNSLTIANAGEAGRVMLISRASGIHAPGALATVVLEHLIRTTGLVIFVVAAALLTRLPLPHDRAGIAVVSVVGGAAALLGSRGIRRLRGRGVAGHRSLAWRRSPRVVRAARVFVARTLASVRRIVTLERLALTAPLTLAVWMCELGSYHAVARAAQLPLSLTGSLMALLAVNLGFVLRATPANVGVFELSYVAAAAAQGAPPG